MKIEHYLYLNFGAKNMNFFVWFTIGANFGISQLLITQFLANQKWREIQTLLASLAMLISIYRGKPGEMHTSTASATMMKVK